MGQRPREIELKLDVAAGEVKALRAGVLAKLGGKGETQRLVSVYYDTAGWDLRAAGVSLRVRRAGSDLVQTVKMARGHAVGLFDRDEWEVTLSGETPDLAAFAETPAAASFDVPSLLLQPVFETRVARTRWTVGTRTGAVEVALDTGRVVAGRRSEALAELELELKRGDAHDLFGLVDDFGAAASLRPGVETKSERGYRVAGHKRRKPVKAEPVRVTPDMTAAAAFQAIVHACLRHFCLNEPLVCERSPEALHQARVSLRRLRSALSLFKETVADTAFVRLSAELKAVSREMGDARNLDVYLAHSAASEKEEHPQEPGLAAFLREMAARRSDAYAHVAERLQAADFRRILLQLVAWVEAGPWLGDADPLRAALRDRPVRVAAADLLRRQRRKVKRKGRRLADLDPAARHRVRIDAKKLRYASEFFAGLATGRKGMRRHADFVAALQALQQHLGDLNDIQTGHEIAASFATGNGATIPVSPGVFAAAHASGRDDARTADLLAAAAAAHRDFRHTKTFWRKWGG